MLKIIKNAVKDIRKLHVFSQKVIWGSLQLTVILYALGAITYMIAPLTPDYFLTLNYNRALLEIAPVTLAAGIIAGLVSDLALRKNDK